MQRNHQAAGNKKIVESQLTEMIETEVDASEIQTVCVDLQKKHDLGETDILLLVSRSMLKWLYWSVLSLVVLLREVFVSGMNMTVLYVCIGFFLDLESSHGICRMEQERRYSC